MRFKVVLDEPQQDDSARIAVHSRLVIGRLACRSRGGSPRVTLKFASGHQQELSVEVLEVDSPEWLDGGRNWSTWRFSGLIWTAERSVTPPASLNIEFGGDIEQMIMPWREFSAAENLDYLRVRESLGQRIKPLLRCITVLESGRTCGSVLVGPEGLTCPDCGSSARRRDGCVDFGASDDLLRTKFRGRNDLPGSFFGDPRTLETVTRLHNGLILDVGSGWRFHYEPNVVHFDSVHFPTTDVVAEGSVLPFADESFDAVFSFSVLEHVKDPMKVVTEMKRVLKKGGEIQVSAPHLIQYHGHPDHFFNPTFRGLQHLLGDDVEVELDETPQWGHPIWGLVEILREWSAALPPEAARRFAKTTVSELSQPSVQLFDRDFVRDLDLAAARGIATNNYIIARKKH